MALSLVLTALKSRQVRQLVTSGVARRFATSATSTREGQGGGAVSTVVNGVSRFFGSLLGNIWNQLFRFQFNITNLWTQIVRGGLFLINFNWNITDQQLDEQIKQAEIALSGAKGGLAGATLGWVVCGAVPTATLAVFNLPMAMHVFKELGEEAAEEIAGLAANLIRLQIDQIVERAFASFFKNYRHVLRPAARGMAQALVGAGVLDQEAVDKMEKNRNEPWSFASALEDTIDRIKDPNERAWKENFWEEFGEACIEAGYVVAGSIDSYMAQQKINSVSILGDERVIEITPIRTSDQ